MRHVRGQTLAETCLALVVLVSVALFSLALADLGFMRVWLATAAHSALFELTAVPVDAAAGAPARARLDASVAATQERHADFDGRAAGALRPTALLFARATAPVFELDVEQGLDAPAAPALRGALVPVGAARVRVRADVEVARLPARFLEGRNGMFSAPNLEDRGFTQRAGGPRVLLGDWGLASRAEGGLCLMGRCRNPALAGLAELAWQRTSGGVDRGAASRLATATFGAPLTDEDAFYLSVSGEEAGFQQPKNGPARVHAHPDNSAGSWSTTPGGRWQFQGESLTNRYAESWSLCRKEAFLGGDGAACR